MARTVATVPVTISRVLQYIYRMPRFKYAACRIEGRCDPGARLGLSPSPFVACVEVDEGGGDRLGKLYVGNWYAKTFKTWWHERNHGSHHRLPSSHTLGTHHPARDRGDPGSWLEGQIDLRRGRRVDHLSDPSRVLRIISELFTEKWGA